MLPTSPAALIDVLAGAPQIIVPMICEMPEANRKRRPLPNKWSAHEHACHLAHVHPLFFKRLDLMLRDSRAKLVPYIPDRDDEDGCLLKLDLMAEMDRYAADRAQLVERLKKLTPEQWSITAEHPEYNTYSIYIMFRHLTMHDMIHGYRIEELLLKKDW